VIVYARNDVALEFAKAGYLDEVWLRRIAQDVDHQHCAGGSTKLHQSKDHLIGT
jgi:hypothetical protein